MQKNLIFLFCSDRSWLKLLVCSIFERLFFRNSVPGEQRMTVEVYWKVGYLWLPLTNTFALLSYHTAIIIIMQLCKRWNSLCITVLHALEGGWCKAFHLSGTATIAYCTGCNIMPTFLLYLLIVKAHFILEIRRNKKSFAPIFAILSVDINGQRSAFHFLFVSETLNDIISKPLMGSENPQHSWFIRKVSGSWGIYILHHCLIDIYHLSIPLLIGIEMIWFCWKSRQESSCSCEV